MTRFALAHILILALALSTPALAGGPPPVSVPSAFLPGQTNILSGETGQRIGIVRPSAFLPEESSLYSPDGQRIIQIEPNPFLRQLNLYDLIGHD